MEVLNSKRKKGSLTVEACIALPVFLCFFYLLLFFTKIACLNIVLDHAVKATAQQLAAVSYPFGFFNEYLDNKIEEGEQSLPDYLLKEAGHVLKIGQQTLEESLLDSILTGKLQKIDLEKLWVQIENQVHSKSYNLVEGALLKMFLDSYLNLKEAGQYSLAQAIFSQQLPSNYLQMGRLAFTLVELPQSSAEYQAKKDRLWYQDFALEPDVDFNKDDVVLQLEYKAIVPMPFLALREVVLCHTAVERAWLYGGNGIYAASRVKEGIDFTKYSKKKSQDSQGEAEPNEAEEDEDVYICRSPTEVYHRFRNCKYIYNKSGVRKINLKEAKEKGLRAHAGCPELFK